MPSNFADGKLLCPDAIAQFRDALQAAGLEPPDIIEAGKLHRFSTNGKGGDDAGWYIFHDDGIPAGAFGDWRGGLSETWRADIGRGLSVQEEAAHRARVEAMRLDREAAAAGRHAEAREKAAEIWQAAETAPEDHPYLTKKGIKAHGLRVHRGALVVPMRDTASVIHSLQFIAEDKRFLTGGRIGGCYFPIGTPDGTLCICEGFATAASIHEATGYSVAAAFSAGNLTVVAKAMRAKFPDLRLILCADDDAATAGNPGLTKATEAALAVGALLAIPGFGHDRPEGATDFNDLHRHAGVEAVRDSIAVAEPVAGGQNTPGGNVASQEGKPNGDDSDDSNETKSKEAPKKSDAVVFARLAKLLPAEYDRSREKEAKQLGIRVATLDAEVSKARGETEEDTRQGQAVAIESPEPWPEPVNGAELLDEIAAIYCQYVVLPKHADIAIALWTVHAYSYDFGRCTPILALTSPQKRCGKTTLISVLLALANKPLGASNISPSCVFRSIDRWQPTLLIDEADSFLKDNEELRGIINSGHTRELAYVIRNVGDDHEPRRFSTWCPKAIALTGC